MATSKKTTKSAGDEPAAKKTKAAKAEPAATPAAAAPPKPAAPAAPPAPAAAPAPPAPTGPTKAQLDEAQQAAAAAKQRADEATRRAEAAEQKALAAEKRATDLSGELGGLRSQLQSAQSDKELAGTRTRELEAQVAGFKLRCPKCGKNFQEELYEGITIDCCSGCNGIYFDAGEVEQLVTKLSQPQPAGFWSGLFGKKSKPPEPGTSGPPRM